eukprot:TRINITY_DN9066_c0_g1_i2.p1 TRINITY_DN9066_c0_g1~~TRINITY_DN9066_c0_g1_i2.p1  ORF type:complete len:347 (-),score=81.59 TRINITY_DN9066_c0_g1_i2:490-1530(-)
MCIRDRYQRRVRGGDHRPCAAQVRPESTMRGLASGGAFIDHVDSVALCRRVAAGLSMSGSLLIIAGAFLNSRQHSLLRLSSFYRLVLWLAVSDFFAAVGAMIGAPTNDTLCGTQAMLLSFFELAGILWSTAIANTIHVTFRRVQQLQRRESLIDYEYALDVCIAELGQGVRAINPALLHALIWGSSAVLTLLPLVIPPGYYGRADGWCWVVNGTQHKTEHRGQLEAQSLRMAMYYLPLYMAVVYNLVVCWLVWKQIRSLPPRTEDSTRRAPSAMLLNLMGFPFVLVFSGAAATVMRLEEIFFRDGVCAVLPVCCTLCSCVMSTPRRRCLTRGWLWSAGSRSPFMAS